MKKFLLLLLLASVCIPQGMQAQAPKKVSIEGTVTEFNSKDPLAGCVVSIPTLELWVVTDGQGRFKMPSVTTGSYTIEVNCLGYEPLSYNVVVKNAIGNLALRMKESSLQLNSVTVTAKKGQSLNTSSTIDRQAMDHLQATSVKDVMQLLPGVLLSNPKLNDKTYNYIGIRDVPENLVTGENSKLNSASVGVYVDGAVVSNDASLVGGRSASGFSQTQDRGIDMRTISTDNIESVEVVRGVASAEYGNLSSGAVIVKTKSGRTPYEVRLKTVPNLKGAALTKGFSLGPEQGFLNIGLDYTNAMKDTRTTKDAYDRGTFSLNYTNTFNRNRTPLQFNAKVSGYLSQGTTKPDPDNVSQDEIQRLDDKSLSINFNGNWLLNKSWITTLKYVLSTTMTREYARNRAASDKVGTGNPGSLEDGEYLVEFTPHDFMSDIRNLSMAYYTNAKLVGELSGRYGNVYNKAMIGFEWNNSGNTGKGMYYEGVRPVSFRPAPFSDLPFINKVAAFAEEKVTLPLGKTSLTLQAGVRVAWISADILKKQTAIDPRFNAKYTIISNRAPKSVRELSIRGGWGIQTTLPSLRMLYPFTEYSDVNSFSWGGTKDGTVGPVDAWTTVVTPREAMQNPGLKMQYSKNFEAGIDFDIFGIHGGVTYYNEKMRDGYSTVQTPLVLSFREYAPYDGDTAPVYIQDPANPGQKVLAGADGQPLPYNDVQVFRKVAQTGNSSLYDKWGIEYTLDFGQIRPIHTSIVVNGAYMNSRTGMKTGDDYKVYGDYSSKVQVDGKDVYNPVFGAYKGDASLSLGTNRERFNSNISFITHIPKLRLIASLTVQCVWIDRQQYRQNSGVYLKEDDNGKRTLNKDPDFYMDAAGNVLPFDPKMYEDPIYGSAFEKYRLTLNNANYFMENSFRPYFMANLRVTKEIGRIAQISFYANNFTNSRPNMLLQNTGTYVRVNTDMYFGAELKLKF